MVLEVNMGRHFKYNLLDFLFTDAMFLPNVLRTDVGIIPFPHNSGISGPWMRISIWFQIGVQ